MDSAIMRANASLKNLVSRQDLVEPKFSLTSIVNLIYATLKKFHFPAKILLAPIT